MENLPANSQDSSLLPPPDHSDLPSNGESAQIAAVLSLVLGIVGVIIGYIITRNKSNYEQRYGSLLMRAQIGLLLWFTPLLVGLLIAGVVMAIGDVDAYEKAVADCRPAPTSIIPENITITVNGESCELSDTGQSELIKLLPKYLVLMLIWFLPAVYAIYICPFYICCF